MGLTFPDGWDISCGSRNGGRIDTGIVAFVVTPNAFDGVSPMVFPYCCGHIGFVVASDA